MKLKISLREIVVWLRRLLRLASAAECAKDAKSIGEAAKCLDKQAAKDSL